MKRFLAGVLCLCLMLTVQPFSASADESTGRNGHERMMVADADSRPGDDKVVYNDNEFAPSRVGWIETGADFVYNSVNLENARYVQICVLLHQDTKLEVYIDDGTTPAATIDAAYNNTYHLETGELSETLTGTYKVTFKVVSGGNANPSWIRFLTEEQYNAPKTTIALVGDSNVELGPFYHELYSMVDMDAYEVINYGVSGATAESYQNTDKCRNSLAKKADYYVITLGSNELEWTEDQINSNFYNNYMNYVNAIWEANPNAKIYAQTTTPLRNPDNPYGTNSSHGNRTEKKIKECIIPALERICGETEVEIIRIYEALTECAFDREMLLTDGVHINNAGGRIMAEVTYDALFPENLGDGTEPGSVTSISVTTPKTELTARGETITLTADKDVYWKVEAKDGSRTAMATIDENGILEAKLPGAYNVVAVSKADTSVRETVGFYNRFQYDLADLEYIFGNNIQNQYWKGISFDARDGGVKIGMNNQVGFFLEDVDLSGITTVTTRAFRTVADTAEDAAVTFHLDAPDGPVIGKCTITDTRLRTNEGWPYRYGDFTADLVPVTDGELHDIFVKANPLGTTGTYPYELLSVDFGALDDNRTVVVKGDEVMDTNSKNFTWTKGEYTLMSLSKETPVSAFYDESGKLIASALFTEENGVQKASLTLSADYPAGTLRTFIWDGLSTMEPVIPASRTYQKPVTIGCVGDSITRELNGTDTDDSNLLSYPKFLQLSLGNRFEVKNFGRGATTAGSYFDVDDYDNAVAAACDIYVLHFGTNDTKSDDDVTNFKSNYKRLIDGFKEANPDCEIYLCLPFPAYENSYGIRSDVQEGTIIPAIRELAAENGLGVIDLFTPVDTEVEKGRLSEFYVNDQVHPTEYGMLYLAELVKEGLLAE